MAPDKYALYASLSLAGKQQYAADITEEYHNGGNGSVTDQKLLNGDYKNL